MARLRLLSRPAAPTKPASQQHQRDCEERATHDDANRPRDQQHGEDDAHSEKNESSDLSVHDTSRICEGQAARP